MQCRGGCEINAQHVYGYHDDGGLNDERYEVLKSSRKEIRHFVNGSPT